MQPIAAIRRFLRRFPKLIYLRRCLTGLFARSGGITPIDLPATFEPYAPFSPGGSYDDRAAMTIRALKTLPWCLRDLGRAAGSVRLARVDAETFGAGSLEAARLLKLCFDKFGSNKACFHNYHHVYAAILGHPDDVRHVLEFGIGSNDESIPGHMGPTGIPGASLRAFRSYLKNAQIYGADIDRRILLQEERIQCFFADQADWSTLEGLGASLPAELDLIVDDGMHAPHTNLHTLRFGLGKVKVGGWVVIEDINPRIRALWEVVAALLPAPYEPHLIDAHRGCIFAVRRGG